MSITPSFSANDARVARASRERIVIVKWDRLRADAIARAAREICPEAEIALYHTADEATKSLRSAPARLGLIGLTLPDSDGLDLLVCAGRERWFERILVVSGRRDERSRHGLRTARIDGFFDCSSEDPAGLPAAIRCVVEGGFHFSPEWLAKPAGSDRRLATLAQLLTETELQVFAVLGDGSDDRQAAARLGMGVTTVHSHRQHIMRKLGVQSRTELMREALRRGVVRFTETGRVLTPGLEHALAERASRSRDPFGSREDPRRASSF